MEIGVGDGIECNCRFLLENGWNGIMIDANTQNTSHVKKKFVTSENINEILKKYAVPKSFDLFSLDVDFNTFWIWKAIQHYTPRVVVIEYNSTIPHDKSSMVEYNPTATWDGTNYFDASLLALANLAKSKGYTLVGCESKGVNAFFIENSLVAGRIKRDIKQMYKPPGYGKIANGIHVGFSPSDKTMMKI